MASDKFHKSVSLLKENNPGIKIYGREDAVYEPLRKTYIVTSAKPRAIARPQTPQDVQALVKVCVDNGLDFHVRTGGHSCVGKPLVDGALLIDMRDIASVHVSDDKTTAKLGGGVLLGGLLKTLGEDGLITPCGSIASVGYVGWATGGGYGPFSSLHGLGLDQIISARLVNSKGELVDANEELLKGIRGAGGIFGIIVELTIKVYPLKEMLVGTLLFESNNMEATWTGLTTDIETMDLPPALYLQRCAMEFPGAGKVFALIATWADDNHDEGRKMIDQIASLGNCIFNMTEAKTAAKYTEDNEKLAVYGVHGRSFTFNAKKWTPATVGVLAKYSTTVPGGNTMLSIHELHSPKPNPDSIFGAREGHLMIEVVALTTDESLKAEAIAWGTQLATELKERDPDNILDSAYISLVNEDEADLEKIYGEHFDTLVSLKKKYDPENVFKHATPKISV